jgi:hypothetical protein
VAARLGTYISMIIHVSSIGLVLSSFLSKRTWKNRLKAWGFEKYLGISDMKFVIDKAEKRAREENKETIFFHGDSEITSERIENFKRRKLEEVIEANCVGK